MVSGSGISLAIYKSAPRPRQITTPASHCSVFTDQMLFLLPNQQRQDLGTGVCQLKRSWRMEVSQWDSGAKTLKETA